MLCGKAATSTTQFLLSLILGGAAASSAPPTSRVHGAEAHKEKADSGQIVSQLVDEMSC